MIAMKNVSILIDSFLESGYVFHKRPLFFWEKSRKPRRFFRLLTKIYGSEKSVAYSLPFFDDVGKVTLCSTRMMPLNMLLRHSGTAGIPPMS